jgi:hypothetical protein
VTKPHTKEPWRLDPNQPDNIERVFYDGCLRDNWCRDPICSEANAARIVACVNACVGMKDPAAEIERLKKAIGLQMEEKHKNAAEALLWFEQTQELSVITAKLQEALVLIAMRGLELSREDCRRIAKEAVGLP